MRVCAAIVAVLACAVGCAGELDAQGEWLSVPAAVCGIAFRDQRARLQSGFCREHEADGVRHAGVPRRRTSHLWAVIGNDDAVEMIAVENGVRRTAIRPSDSILSWPGKGNARQQSGEGPRRGVGRTVSKKWDAERRLPGVPFPEG